MNRKKNLFPVLTLLALLAVAGSGYAGVALAMSHLAGPTPSVMSYQGYLTDSLGMPITGTPDFDFRIWDAASGGSQVWAEIQTNVPVTNGYFSVMLGSVNPLAAAHFTGPRFLEVRVDMGSGWTILPRQLLGAVPFAYQAEQADLANQASTALSVAWNAITGRPAGLDDGDNDILAGLSCADGQVPKYNFGLGVWQCQDDDDTLASLTCADAEIPKYDAGLGVWQCKVDADLLSALSCTEGQIPKISSGVWTCQPDDDTTYTAGDGLKLVGTQFSAEGTPYDHVIIVAKSGGDFTSIQAALNSITTPPPGPTDRYLVWIGPGAYQERVTMRPYVDLMGAGENQTFITYTGPSNPSEAVVKGANNVMLSLLTIQCNANGAIESRAMLNIDASPVLRHVDIYSSNAMNYTIGVENQGSGPTTGSNPVLEDVTIQVNNEPGDAGTLYGILNQNSSYPKLHNVDIHAFNGDTGYGIYNIDSTGFDISDSYITISNLTSPTGIQTSGPLSHLDQVVMDISGTGSATGIGALQGNIDIRNLDLTVVGEANAYGIATAGIQEWFDSTVRVNVGETFGTVMGIFNLGLPSGKLTLNRFEILTGGNNSEGLNNQDSSALVNRTRIEASGVAYSYGIHNLSMGAPIILALDVMNSQIKGGMFAIVTAPPFITQIGASYLGAPAGGPAVFGPATCAGVYNILFAFFPGPACP